MTELAEDLTPVEDTFTGDYATNPDVWSDIEARVLYHCESLLGLANLGAHDDLFDLGANSLTIMRLDSLLESDFEVQIPVDDIFADPTIHGVANLIRASDPHHVRPLAFTLGAERYRTTPVTLVHAVTGDTTHLGPFRPKFLERPVHLIRATGLEEDETPASDIETMSRAYASALHRLQPHGPFVVMGHSMGGLIALELGRQLQLAGRETALVILLATESPTELRKIAPVTLDEAMRLRLNEILDRIHAAPEDRAEVASYLEEAPAAQLSDLTTYLKAKEYLPPEMEPADLQRRIEVFAQNALAGARYDLCTYHFPVLVVDAADGVPEDWDTHVSGGVTTVRLPVHHREFFSGNLELLEIVRSTIDDVLEDQVDPRHMSAAIGGL